MKVVTIFSGKGGVGKTTMSILFSSWLKYYKGERVVAYDFESPESRMMDQRTRDLELLKLKSPSLTVFTDDNTDFYPMGAIKSKPGGYSERELSVIADKFAKAKATGPGYIICDFPGRFESTEAIYKLVHRGLIDLIVFPLQPEEQSVTSMLVVNKYLKEPGFVLKPDNKPQEILCFWNMVTRGDRTLKNDILAPYEELFSALSIPVSTTRINFIDTMKRSASSNSVVKTTVCYPRKNIIRAFPPRSGEDAPYIENLFEEIKERLDKA